MSDLLQLLQLLCIAENDKRQLRAIDFTVDDHRRPPLRNGGEGRAIGLQNRMTDPIRFDNRRPEPAKNPQNR